MKDEDSRAAAFIPQDSSLIPAKAHGIDVWHRVMETRGLFPQYPVEQVQALEAIFEAAGAEVLARGIREWRRSKKIQYRTLRSFLAFSEHFVGEAARGVAQDRRLFHGGR